VVQEIESDESVFDFFYVDRRRIDIYLAQLSDFGNLSKLVRSVRVSDESRGDLDVKILRGGTTSRQETNLEKHYDAQFTAPLVFLDEANARSMLRADVEAANIGDLLLLSGTLNVIDIQAFQKAFEAMSSVTPTGNVDKRTRQQRRANPLPPMSDFDPAIGFRLLASLDQPMIMLFEAAEKKYWSTIDTESIVGSSTDLHLKHGVTISGEWQMVGILDCYPGTNAASTIPRFCGQGDNVFSDAMSNILRELRIIMGRPADCYGITPLVIMREVS
jgi:hypothetical protein